MKIKTHKLFDARRFIFLLPVATLLLGLSLTSTRSESILKPPKYPDHLPGAYTGGFGEETCRSCHFDYPLNHEEGSLSVSGIPQKITKGSRFEINISVERKNLGSAGFQLTARFPDGSQAGDFKIENNKRILFTQKIPDSLQYVQHSKTGTEPLGANKNSWKIIWQAPASPKDSVIFNIAANASNGDRSSFGDFIYKREIKAELTDK